MARAKRIQAGPISASGSGSEGLFVGADFRRAYVPGLTLTGAGQIVGLLELDGYYSNDIVTYENSAGYAHVPVINVNVTNFTGPPGDAQIEVALDIELAIAMAPGLSSVMVFQAGSSVSVDTAFDDILDSMASSNQISQFSSSWGYTGGSDPNTTIDMWLQKMQTQGQTFFQASGDGDAWINPIWTPGDSPNLTSVGGTSLTMNGSGASYASETVWNEGNQSAGWPANESTGSRRSQNDYIGSSGGVSTVYAIPSWQTNAVNSTNHGSAARRNIPDVSMTAQSIFVVASNGIGFNVGGTSCAAPLWAGFAALLNQQAARAGTAPVGFINPAIYSAGAGTNYSVSFHDIQTGNNTNLHSTNLFPAVSGYDLCTGWGSPNGMGTIDIFVPEPLLVLPTTGFVSTGVFGGPFSVTSESFLLTNAGVSAINWSLVNTSIWLAASSSNGSIASGASATVTVSLTSAATNLVAGIYSSSVIFSNQNDGFTLARQFSLAITKATPALTWAAPASIVYGAPLDSSQLNATANVPGVFNYNPAAGTVLAAGTNLLSVTFTPSDTADFNTVSISTPLVVVPAALSVTANNATRPFGAPNPAFTGTIAGVTNGDNITAAFSSAATTNSPVGNYSIAPALIDPNNRETNYIVSLTAGILTISPAQPALAWVPPAPIVYGTALSSNQLDAAANLPGNFSYTPAVGAYPPPGTNALTVLFTPSDSSDFSNAAASVNLVVTLSPIPLGIQLVNTNVVLTWNDPDDIFSLQSAPSAMDPFTNMPGAASPYTNATGGAQQYFQLAAPAQ